MTKSTGFFRPERGRFPVAKNSEPSDQAKPPEAGSGTKNPRDIPLWVVVVAGIILSGLSVLAVFLFVKPTYTLPAPAVKLESWEYWGGRLHLKIEFNTSTEIKAGRNFVNAGKGCYFEVNYTSIVGESAFAAYSKALTNRSGDFVYSNRTKLNKTNATIETALSRIYAFYCAQRAYVLKTSNSCDLVVREAVCEI
jgi:hypothetical protein